MEAERAGLIKKGAAHAAAQAFAQERTQRRAVDIGDLGGDRVEQLTIDHSVAQALVSSGVLTEEEAKVSPWQHVLHKFLDCAEMTDGTDVRPFTPEGGDRLLLGSAGLTNHITEEDLRLGPSQFPDPQRWSELLVNTALDRGSRDNVTCVVVAFERE